MERVINADFDVKPTEDFGIKFNSTESTEETIKKDSKSKTSKNKKKSEPTAITDKSKTKENKRTKDKTSKTASKNRGDAIDTIKVEQKDKSEKQKKVAKKSAKGSVDEKKAKALKELEAARKSADAAKECKASISDKTSKGEETGGAVKFNKTDLLISFDTTGSMYTVLAQVRREISKLVTDIKNALPNVRIGIIAHGDYCDKDNPYTIRLMDFTDDTDSIIDFVKNTESTYGGDSDECYELVLNTAANLASWSDKDSNKIMIMIGDANPHGVNYPQNTNKLDWHREADDLAKKGIKVFAVHALSYYRHSSRMFYETVASKTGGTYLTLDQFSDIQNLIIATCSSQFNIEKLSEFVELVKSQKRMTNSLARNINRLAGKELVAGVFEDYVPEARKTIHRARVSDTTEVQKSGLTPIAPGRFQVLDVDVNTAIKEFVNDNGLKFSTGRGFYELTKAESVQQYKEVILQDKDTGEMFNGAQVREFLGLQPQIVSGGVTEKLYSTSGKGSNYRIFVQSTSVNRKLIGGTKFLYEVADI